MTPLIVALLGASAACEPEGYTAPGPDTSPSRRLQYSEYYRTQVDRSLTTETFGRGSTELKVTIVGQEAGGRDHVIDFAAPAESRMDGYGDYLGFTETFRRTRLVDDSGVHAVRVAVYRTDAERNHTNVWTHTLARADSGSVFLINQEEWDWIGGEEDLAGFSEGIWPFYSEIQKSRRFYDSFFGFSPGIYARSEFIRQVILSTRARSPTHGVEGCVQVLFNAANPVLRHQAFLHERFGLVEVVYRWEELPTSANEYPLTALSGFAVPEQALTPLPLPASVTSELGGSWAGTLTFQPPGSEDAASEGDASGDDPEGEAPLPEGGSPAEGVTRRRVRMDFADVGVHYSERTRTYDLNGTYNDDDISLHLRGRYKRRDDLLEAVSGGNTEETLLHDVFVYASPTFTDGALKLNVTVFRSTGGDYERASGLLERRP